MSTPSVYDLPQLEEIFDALRRGRHLCTADGKPYGALRDNLAAYQDLFQYAEDRKFAGAVWVCPTPYR